MKKRTVITIVIALIAFLVPFIWLRSGELIAGTDVLAPFTKENADNVTQLWDSTDSVGKSFGAGLYVQRWFIWGIPLALEKIGLSPSMGQAAMFGMLLALWVWTLGFFLGAFKLSRLSFALALIFGLSNPFIVERAHDAETIVTLALLALSLGSLIRVKNGASPLTFAAVASLPTVLVPILNPSTRFAGLLLIPIVGFFLWRASEAPRKRAILHFFGYFLILWLIVTAPFLYAYWVFVDDQANYAASGALDWLHGVSANASIPNVVRLIGAWDWFAMFSGETYLPLARFYQSLVGIIITSVPLALVAYAGVRKRKFSYWHGILIAGIFLAAGTHPPFGALYQWLFDHVPGFWLFRSPWYKFSMWLVIAYTLLISGALDLIWHQMKRKWARAMIALLIGLVFIASGWPLFTGARYPRVAERSALAAPRVHIPDYAYEAAQWVRQNTQGGRVLLLPQHRFNSSEHTWGYGGLVPIQQLLFDPVPVIYRNFLYESGENQFLTHFETALRSQDPKALNFLLPLNVEFILLQKDFAYQRFNTEDETSTYQALLGKIPGISRAETFGQWELWQTHTRGQRAAFSPYIATLPNIQSVDEVISGNPNTVFTHEQHPELAGIELLNGSFDLSQTELSADRFRLRLPRVPAETYFVTSAGSSRNITVNGSPLPGTGKTALGNNTVIEAELTSKPVVLTNNDFITTQGWTLVTQTPEAVSFNAQGEGRLEINDSNRALLYQTLPNFDPSKAYLVTLRYRTEGQANWQVGFDQHGPEPVRHRLDQNSEFTTVTAFISPHSNGGQTQFEILGEGNGTIVIENVSLAQVERATGVTIASEIPITPEPVKIEQLSASSYRIQGTASREGVLVFNEGFAPGWRAIEGSADLFHFRAQGYANGWKIPHQGAFDIRIEYAPQRTFGNLILVSAILLLIFWTIVVRKRGVRAPPPNPEAEPRWVLPVALVVLGCLALTPLLWFREHTIITGADINFPLDPVSRFIMRLSSWGTATNAGADQSSLFASLVFHGVQAVPAALGFSLIWVERLELIFWNALIGFSFFIFIREVLGKRFTLAALIATIFWLFNPYRIVMWTETNVAIIAASIALPLWLTIGMRVWRGGLNPLWAAIAVGAVMLLCSGMGLNPPMLVLALGAFTLFWIAGVIRVRSKRQPLKAWLQFGSLSVIWAVIFNGFWMLPFASSLVGQAQSGGGLQGLSLLDWVEGLSRDTSLWNVARLQGAWDWYQNYKAEPYITFASTYRQSLPLLAISIVPLAGFIIGLIALRKRPWWQAFIVLLVFVGILFGMGVHQPAQGIFGWASEHVPGFWMFRSPWYKFTLWTTLGYSVGIAVALVWLNHYLPRFRTYALTLAALGVIFIVFGFPLITGKHYPTSKERTELNNFHVQVPDYIFEATKWLNEQATPGKVLFLPKEVAYNYTWGYGAAGDISFDLIKRPIITPLTFSQSEDTFSSARLIDLTYEHLYQRRHDETLALLDTLDVTYFLHKRDSRYDFYQNLDSPQFIHERLAAFPEIKLVKTFGQWDIYERVREGSQALVAKQGLALASGTTQDFTSGITLAHQKGLAIRFFDQPQELASADLDRAALVLSFADPNALKEVNNSLELTFDAPQDGAYELIAQGTFRTPFRLELGGAQFTSQSAQTLGNSWSTLGTVTLTKGQHTATIQNLKPSKNLVVNADFSASGPTGFAGWESKDCDADAPGVPAFDLQPAQGPTGQSAARVTALGHVHCLTQKITTEFYPDAIYKLSFDAKTQSGAAASYTIWQQGPNTPRPKGTLSDSGEWEHTEIVFKPEVSTQSLELFFYADGRLGRSETLYANVRLVRLSDSFTSIALQKSTALSQTEPVVSILSQSPTAIHARLTNANEQTVVGLLTGFAPGWSARINKDGKVRTLTSEDHFAYAGYGNAWQPKENGEYEIMIEYAPQRLFHLGLVIAVAGGLLVGALAVFNRRRKR